jgi:predicted PurR-regulated permease PerM
MQTATLQKERVLYLLGFTVVVLILYFGKALWIPLFFAGFVAIVLYPVCKKLESFGWPRTLAITVCLLMVTILILALLLLLVWQIKLFREDAPLLIAGLESRMPELQIWLKQTFGIELDLQHHWRSELLGLFPVNFSATITAIVNGLVISFLIPVFTALLLYHRGVFVQFLQSVTTPAYREKMDGILKQSIHIYARYIKGMIFVYLIVGLLNSTGLFLLGVKHPLMYGMICAIMTIIPYIGTTISSLLPITVIWLQTGNFWYPVGVVAVFVFVQYLEANVIFPKVVGKQLNVSTFAVLVAIIAGGILWGISGMVLFIPIISILKIMSDHLNNWKPLNLILKR